MSNWNKIGKPIVVLCLICVVITGALAATNSATAPVIKAAEEAAAQAARTELLPEATGFTLVEGEFEGVTEIYTADNGVGTIITSSDKGYSCHCGGHGGLRPRRHHQAGEDPEPGRDRRRGHQDREPSPSGASTPACPPRPSPWTSRWTGSPAPASPAVL